MVKMSEQRTLETGAVQERPMEEQEAQAGLLPEDEARTAVWEMAQRHGCGLGSVGLGDSKGDSVTRVNLRGDNGGRTLDRKMQGTRGRRPGNLFFFL